MDVSCKCCGRIFNAYRKDRKYCPTCAEDINNSSHLYGSYVKAAKALIEKRKAERENTERLNRLRNTAVSIDYVVHEAMSHGRSYGHEVAVMEGREH